ncbi:MAG: hypothetical protein H8D97_01200 [Proteobacteria bacterium]|nr:hypothetical protein [Pseudomonadota bacterium]
MNTSQLCKNCKWISYKNNPPFTRTGVQCTNTNKVGWSTKPEIGFSLITGKPFKEKGSYKYCNNLRSKEGNCGEEAKFFECISQKDIFKRFLLNLGVFDLIIIGILVLNVALWFRS